MLKPSSPTFRVTMTARLRHGDLLHAIRERGWTLKQAAAFLGISQCSLGGMINLRHVPTKMLRRADFVDRLYELTGKLPDELWPEFIRTDDFFGLPKVIEATQEIDPKFLAEGHRRALPPMPDEVLEQQELQAAIAAIMETLPDRMAKVIRHRFLEGKSLAETGRLLHVSRGRVWQVEVSAMRKLRHPSRLRFLRKFL